MNKVKPQQISGLPIALIETIRQLQQKVAELEKEILQLKQAASS